MDNNNINLDETTNVTEQTFGSPIDNGNTKDLKESVNEMQTFLDEPKTQKGGKGSLITIIILVVIALGLGGYIGYDKFINTGKKCDVPTEPTAKEKYETYLENIKEREYADYASFDYTENEESKRREYVLGTDNKLYILSESENEVTIPGAKGNGGEFKGKETSIDKVVRMYTVSHTDGTENIQDETLGLLLVKEDGTVTIIRHPEKEEIKEETLDNKYIVDVYSPLTNISKTLLIDIDGKISILK